MQLNFLRASIVAAIVSIAPAAFAANLDGLKYVGEHTHTLKDGRVLTVIVGEMNGQKMAIIPMDDMHDLFARAEGHSMATP